jgi:hypothetical protein
VASGYSLVQTAEAAVSLSAMYEPGEHMSLRFDMLGGDVGTRFTMGPGSIMRA